MGGLSHEKHREKPKHRQDWTMMPPSKGLPCRPPLPQALQVQAASMHHSDAVVRFRSRPRLYLISLIILLCLIPCHDFVHSVLQIVTRFLSSVAPPAVASLSSLLLLRPLTVNHPPARQHGTQQHMITPSATPSASPRKAPLMILSKAVPLCE